MSCDGSWQVTDGRWRVIDASWRVTDGRWRVIDASWRVTDGRWRVIDASWRVTDGRWRVIDASWRVTDGRWRVIDGRWRVTDGRWRVIDASWRVTDGRWRVTDGSVTNNVRKGPLTEGPTHAPCNASGDQIPRKEAAGPPSTWPHITVGSARPIHPLKNTTATHLRDALYRIALPPLPRVVDPDPHRPEELRHARQAVLGLETQVHIFARGGVVEGHVVEQVAGDSVNGGDGREEFVGVQPITYGRMRGG